MDAKFWHGRWAHNQIAFHERDPNPLLVEHVDALALAPGHRVFVPWCGKTRDIHWLLCRDYRVAGAELSPIAIEQLVAELGVCPQRAEVGGIVHYFTPDLDLFVGDFFHVPSALLGPVDAIYDRAALVALPHEMRIRYAAHLMEITQRARQLLITYEYLQSQMDGPPFSVSTEEVQRHYGDAYEVMRLASTAVPGGLKGQCAALENLWLLRPR